MLDLLSRCLINVIALHYSEGEVKAEKPVILLSVPFSTLSQPIEVVMVCLCDTQSRARFIFLFFAKIQT